MEISLDVRVDPRVTGLVADSVSFETGLTRAQAADPTLYAYEHHGEEFTHTDPGALSSLYEDMMLGRPMPTNFVTRQLSVDTVVAITLFLNRYLVTHPLLARLVYQVDLAHRRGIAGLAHVEEDTSSLIRVIMESLSVCKDKTQESRVLQSCVGYVKEFLEEGYVNPVVIHNPTVKDVGSNGFVVAEMQKSEYLTEGWLRLYQWGYLRGILYTPEKDRKSHVMAARKSVFVEFNLTKAAAILNEVESLATNLPGTLLWSATEEYLYSPLAGTTLWVEDVLKVLLRV